MRLTDVELAPSPLGRGRVRLAGEVTYRGSSRRPEQIWFDVPEAFAGDLSTSGNPWLAALLPLAVTLGEPLELCRPVDPALREGAEVLMQVWRTWYPALYRPVTIECAVLPEAAPDAAARTGAFFSGGVDSFHTLLRYQPGGGALHPMVIDDLVTVWGLDIPLEAPEAFERLSGMIAGVAHTLGKTPVTLATNLRQSGWNVTNWGKMSQGPALASVALALESRYRRMLIPSSVPYHSLRPWGTHPLTDSLLSTSRTQMRSDGSLSRRMEKVEMLVESELALRNLHVCWMGQADTNCGNCEKCLRTLTLFELLGARDRCVSFPADAWSLDALAGLRLRQDIDLGHMNRLAAHAVQFGRHDIARAVRRSIRRYQLRRAAGRLARAVGLRRPPPT
jgi:hypothetical protein